MDPKASLGKLAEAYWTKRLIDKDYKATYEMEAAKDSLPFTEYKKKVFNAGQIQYFSIKTTDVKVENNRGVVALIVNCRISQVPKNLDMKLTDDQWVLTSDTWKHVLKKK